MNLNMELNVFTGLTAGANYLYTLNGGPSLGPFDMSIPLTLVPPVSANTENEYSVTGYTTNGCLSVVTLTNRRCNITVTGSTAPVLGVPYDMTTLFGNYVGVPTFRVNTGTGFINVPNPHIFATTVFTTIEITDGGYCKQTTTVLPTI
jgi:hypothetical protein